MIDAGGAQKAWRIAEIVAMLLLLMLAMAWPRLVRAQSIETYGVQSPAITASGNVAVTYGISPEQVQNLIKAARAGDTDKIADLSGKLGVTQGAAATMLRIIGEQDVPLEKLPQKLAEVAEQYKSATARLKALDPQDPVTRDLVARAEAAIKAGHLDEADQLVSQAEQVELTAARQAQQLAQQAQAAADQRLLRAAQDRSVRGDIAMTGLHYQDAARHFQEAAELVPAGHPEEKGRFMLAQADALESQGGQAADSKAVAICRAALNQYARDQMPLQWGMAQNGLGHALRFLGGWEVGTASLEEAVAAHRAALEELTRDRVPLDWARTQAYLGDALQVIDWHGTGTARLGEAVIAYRAALEEQTRDRVPLDWARTQNALGVALWYLGVRGGATARLDEAVLAFLAALEERTRDRVALDWAQTEANLGSVLRALGERESGTAR